MSKGRTPPTPGKVVVSAGYGANTRVPYVEITLPDRAPIQLEIDEARLIASMILESCESAEQDAFLVEWTMEAMAVPVQQAAGILHAYRTWRAARLTKKKARTA